MLERTGSSRRSRAASTPAPFTDRIRKNCWSACARIRWLWLPKKPVGRAHKFGCWEYPGTWWPRSRIRFAVNPVWLAARAAPLKLRNSVNCGARLRRAAAKAVRLAAARRPASTSPTSPATTPRAVVSLRVLGVALSPSQRMRRRLHSTYNQSCGEKKNSYGETKLWKKSKQRKKK